MTALQRKLLRDLRSIRGQVITVSLVIAAGVASYAAFVGAWRSLVDTRTRYYEEARFADVFAHVKRAPEDVLDLVSRIPGVAQAEAREVEEVRLDLPEVSEPAYGTVVSIPSGGPLLNALSVCAGRFPEPGRPGEVLVHAGFARAHGLEPGGSVAAVLNGKRVMFRVVGIALSPEFVLAIPPMHGGAADDSTYGVFWMDRTALAVAFRMEGAFNDVVLRLSPGASAEAVIERLDRVLAPYGGISARDRSRQPSNRALVSELKQLQVEATLTPLIFLAVAAFLVNVVLSRLVGTQREQIAALKALGYSNREVAVHFLELVLVVVFLGGALGIGLGAVLGDALMDLYARYFRFPALEYRLDAVSTVTSLLVASVASFGSLFSVRQAARLPPAEGMRPPAPAAYKPLLVDRLGIAGAVSQGARMILRDLERAPLRLVLSALGAGKAISVLVAGRFFGDALDRFFDRQFRLIQREHVAVEFMKEVPTSAVHELEAIPGVLRAEPVRYVLVRLRAGHLRYDTAVQGLGRDADLRRVIDERDRGLRLPDEGLFVSPELARRLDLCLGDELRLEVLDGSARVRQVRVVGWFDQVTTLMSAMERSGLDRLLGGAPVATGAALAIDLDRADAVSPRLKEFPLVSSASSLTRMVRVFEEQNTEILRVMTAILVVFAAAITVGVVYNNARVALAVRARDLATLRVLGYTRGEVSALLIGELAAAVLLGIPVGLVLGNLLAGAFAGAFDRETLQLEAVITAQSRAFAVTVALVTAAASALLVHWRLDSLDLVGVLKARDPVELGTALRAPLEVTVAEPGRTRVRQRFVVAAPVGGTLQRIALRPGETVQRGELLARIRPLDPPLLDARTRAQALSRVRATAAAREQAQEQLERARALLGFAQAESMRQVLLARTGSAPQRSAEAAEVEEWARRKEAASASWAVDAATSELESARATVRRFDVWGESGSEVEVRAPTSGVILRVAQESEGPIAAGTPIIELGDPSELEIAVDLLTQDAVRMAPGAMARIERWGGDGSVAARVRKVEPSGFTRISALGVEEQRVTVVLDAAEPVPRLGDGFRVEVAITVFAAPDVLQIPASSVFRTDATWSVFVAAYGRVQVRPIDIGQRNDSAVEVRSGLSPGERVLLHPSDRVKPGVRYVERAPVATGV